MSLILLLFMNCSLYFENGQWGSRLTYEDIELTYKKGLYYYFDRPFTGIVHLRYQDKSMKAEQKYQSGKKDGIWEWYYQDGRIQRKEFWKNGELTKTMNWD